MYFTATSGRESSGVCRFPQAPLGFSFFFRKETTSQKKAPTASALGLARPQPKRARSFAATYACTEALNRIPWSDLGVLPRLNRMTSRHHGCINLGANLSVRLGVRLGLGFLREQR